jgi:dipeptide transport system substrate-binding protein
VEGAGPAHPDLVMTGSRSLARAALAAAVLACCGAAAHAASGGTLTVCTENSPDGFDMVQYEAAVTTDAAGRTIYDQLVMFQAGSTEIAPGIAEKWDISPDGTVYTFHIRHGVKVHSTPWFKPTRELNADDVVWSINRVNDPKHPAHNVAKNGYVYWEGMGLSKLIKSVQKVDPYTVRITLTRPEAPFLADMAVESIGSIYSAEYGEQLLKSGHIEDINTKPIGTGPFIFQSYQKDSVIRYLANKAHWQGAPAIDKLVFAITSDPSVRIQRLKAGECLVGANMKPEQASAFEHDPQVQMQRNDHALLSFYIAPNTKHKWLSDRRVREALWDAIDTKTFIQAIYGGNAVAGGSFLPPGMWSFDKSLAPRHDPVKAKQLVKASGYDGSPLTMYVRIGGSIDGKRAAELLQNDWAKAGLNVQVRMMEWGELLKRSGRGEHDITFLLWASDNGDPDNFMTPNFTCASVDSGGNKSQWCNPAFDKLIDEARRTIDHAKRVQLYTQAQKMVYEEVAAIPLVYPTYMTAVNKRVHGIVDDPFTRNDFRHASIQ